MGYKNNDLSAEEVESLTKPGSYPVCSDVALRLVISPTGTKRWQAQGKINGVKTTRGLGSYKSVSLEDAKKAAKAMREAMLNGEVHVAPGRKAQELMRAKTLSLSSQGKDAHEIAAKLGIAVVTVYRHLKKAKGDLISTDAPWARVMRENAEVAGHAMAARVLELAEPAITEAIRRATWEAIGEILGADRELAREEYRNAA